MNPGLSARELQVAQLVAAGLRNREIGANLGISEQTVKNHVARILAKLAFDSRASLAVWAVRRMEAR